MKDLLTILRKDSLADHEYAAAEELLADLYRFHIMNPRQIEGYEYALWIQLDDKEYPILQSNSLGHATFLSASEFSEGGIEPTSEFWQLTAYSFHEMMSFTPVTYAETEGLLDLADNIYDGKWREYEVWAAQEIINRLFFGDELFPEIEPIARWCDHHTEFGTPILGDL